MVDNYDAPRTRPEPPRRGGGLRALLMLLAVAVVATAGGAGGAYWAMSTLDAPEPAPSSSESGAPEPGLSGPSGGADLPGSAVTLPAPPAGTLTEAVQRASAGVVEIYTEATQMSYFGQYIAEGAGSGVILTEDGYLATNRHVINGAQSIRVRLSDGSEYEAEVVAADRQTDLAVLKIDAEGLTPVVFVDDADAPEVGEAAIAIGNPLGTLGGTVTDGIISAKGREITLDGQTMTLLQTSAAVNPGNSGGGLFNAGGELVGIVVAKSSSDGGTGIEGLGFAIPADVVREVAFSLIGSGYVTGRPQIGVTVEEIITADAAMERGYDRFGVFVRDTAGGNSLLAGDLILEADGVRIARIADLTDAVAKHRAGESMTMRILRDGEELTVEVPLTEKPPDTEPEAEPSVDPSFGLPFEEPPAARVG